MSPTGNAQLDILPHYVKPGFPNKIEVTNHFDVLQFLELSCRSDGREEGCQRYAQLGGHYSEAERQQAIEATEAALDRSAANSQAKADRANTPGFMSSLAGALTSVQQSTPTIQETAAQNQANLQAAALATQQRQQAQERARLAAEQNARAGQATTTNARSIPSNANASSSSTTVASAPTPNPTYNPYSSTPVQGSYNPYTGTGSGSIQGSCTDMTGSVQGSVKIGSDGWVSGYLTNNSNQALFVSYTFKQNGVPSTAMANAGGTTIQGGQTVGGEGQGLYSTGADKNAPQIYWYAVLKSEHDQYGCVHKW
jgi:hypothetical protein